MTHICVRKPIIIGWDNGLSPGRRQAIIWTNTGILLIGPLGTNFSEILIEIDISSFQKTHLKMSSAKCRPSCLGLNVLICQVNYSLYGFIHRYCGNQYTVEMPVKYPWWTLVYVLHQPHDISLTPGGTQRAQTSAAHSFRGVKLFSQVLNRLAKYILCHVRHILKKSWKSFRSRWCCWQKKIQKTQNIPASKAWKPTSPKRFRLLFVPAYPDNFIKLH